ncbi:MAG: hypothetical protein NXH90_13625 [Flavobacteriaceae bacterium]|nr:hypothetical protein [Flavobacteriaceae bacterium]
MAQEKDITVKLVAAFRGITFLPGPFVIGSNNANPKLVLGKNHIEYRNLVRTHKKTYAQIKKVDVYINSFRMMGVGTTNICLTFKDSMFTFSGNLNDKKRLQGLVAYFVTKGVPLTEKAKRLLEDNVD